MERFSRATSRGGTATLLWYDRDVLRPTCKKWLTLRPFRNSSIRAVPVAPTTAMSPGEQQKRQG
eukprot:14628-Eustigmatos_ZCMA.PRE.1